MMKNIIITLKNLKDNRGNIAIIVVVSLTVLIGMLALVVDGGYLYTTKDKYQNGVEAAALAGAVHICGGDYEDISRQIALENGIPYSSESLAVILGHYDLGDEYDDFAVYKDFVADSDTSTSYNDELSDPDNDLYIYNNAVMVSLNVNVSTFLAGIFGKEEVAVSAKAVGVARSVGLLSFGNDPDTSGVLISNWPYMYADFKNMGVIHSNTDVEFDNTPRVTLSGDTVVTATGEVIGCPDGGVCISGKDVIDTLTPLDQIMNELHAEAEAEGHVIVMDDMNFPRSGRYDAEGNCYYTGSWGHYVFAPYDGNHNGAVYYFSGTGHRLAFKGDVDGNSKNAWNFTVAADTDLTFTTVVGFRGLYLGGNDEDMVHFYTRGDVGGPGPNMNIFGCLGAHHFNGVTFRVGGYFGISPSDGQSHNEHKLRVIAEGIINISGKSMGAEYSYSADFGPPCPPTKVGLGKLELVGG